VDHRVCFCTFAEVAATIPRHPVHNAGKSASYLVCGKDSSPVLSYHSSNNFHRYAALQVFPDCCGGKSGFTQQYVQIW
jgi:hypothetical protein